MVSQKYTPRDMETVRASRALQAAIGVAMQAIREQGAMHTQAETDEVIACFLAGGVAGLAKGEHGAVNMERFEYWRARSAEDLNLYNPSLGSEEPIADAVALADDLRDRDE